MFSWANVEPGLTPDYRPLGAEQGLVHGGGVPYAAGSQALVPQQAMGAMGAMGGVGGVGGMGGMGGGFGGQDGDDVGRLMSLDSTIKSAITDSSTFSDLEKVRMLQDSLYERFVVKYRGQVAIDDQLTPDRMQLLGAIKSGDVPAIRAFIKRGSKFKWNFVYPPSEAVPSGNPFSGSSEPQRPMEAWCRSPLCLLVRPEEGGHLDGFMPNVTREERYALIKEVLGKGSDVADPNFPPVYWCSPAVHACLEGDLKALEILYGAGCKLDQTVEYACQSTVAWTLAHAAALAGHLEVLEYLSKKVSPQILLALDAEGSSPLHTLIGSSNCLDCARFLIENGADACAVNNLQRSPLSMAIEVLPELAEEILASKSVKHHKWWSQDLYWFSFDGVELPQSGKFGPLEVSDVDGASTTILELIVKHRRLELVMTPLVRDLVELKWLLFGRRLCFSSIALLTALLSSAWAVSRGKSEDSFFFYSSIFFWITMTLETSRTLYRLKVYWFSGGDMYKLIRVSSDLVSALTAMYAVYRKSIDTEAAGQHDTETYVCSIIMSLIQVYYLVRVLFPASLFRFIGPMLISLFHMIADVGKFLLIIAAVTMSWANAFSSLVHFGLSEEEVGDLDYDFSYPALVKELLNTMMGAGDTKVIVHALPYPLSIGGSILRWSFSVVAFVALMNLLIAVLNTSYTKVEENAVSEWNFRRLTALLDLQTTAPSANIRDYFDKLNQFNNKRTTMEFL